MSRTGLHHGFYRVVRVLLIPIIRLRFNFTFERIRSRHHPHIVLANHTTNWDPLLLALSFPEHMYFVATEHIFRSGFLSKLLQFFIAPIMRLKTRTEMYTAMAVLRALKAGENVCMFAEAGATWNGETSPIVPSTAKLVRRSGAALITYRVEGGYLSLPRWSRTIRRGAMRGYLVREYSPEQLKKMSDAEIERAITDDLYCNAFDHNARARIRFTGRRMAEHLEAALYYCPECGAISSLHSRDDTLTCADCGLALRYNAYGLFESLTARPVPFNTILEWDRWQRENLIKHRAQYLSLPGDQPICQDAGQRLYAYEAAGDSRLRGEGTLLLYKDRLELKDERREQALAFPFDEISDMSSFKQTTLLFTVNGRQHYEVRSATPRSTLKYLMFCHVLGGVKVLP